MPPGPVALTPRALLKHETRIRAAWRRPIQSSSHPFTDSGIPHSWAGDVAEKLIMTASCGRRPVVDGQAGEQYASLTRLELPVAVKALAGVWLCVAQLDAKRVIPVHVHVLD